MGTPPRCRKPPGPTQLEEDEVKANPTQQVVSLDEHGQGSYLRTNQTKQICGLITYMKHVFSEYMSEGVRPDPFYPFSSEEWSQQTSTMMRTFLVQNLPTQWDLVLASKTSS